MFRTKNNILLLLTISTFFLMSSGKAAQPAQDYSAYYQFLESVSSDSSAQQIAKLKRYVQQHPAFHRTYRQLLNLMLVEGQAKEAKAYFLKTSASPEHQNYSRWMVAKIAAIQDSLVTASNLFRQVILNTTPPFKLLDDYAFFLHENAQRYDGVAEIKKLNLDPTQEHAALAFLYRRRMEFEQAIEVIGAEDTQDTFILHVLGYCYYKIRDYARAEPFFQRGLQLARSHGDLKFQVYNLMSLAILARQKNNGDEEKKLHQALSIVTRVNDLGMLHLVKNSLGTLYLAQKKNTEALQAYKDAIRISKPLGLSRATAQQYRGKAQALFALGEFNAILPALEQNEKYAKKANDLGEIYSNLLERGKFYNHLNLTSLAEQAYGQAYKLGQTRIRHRRHVSATRYADLLVEQGKYDTARTQYLEFLKASDMPLVYRAYWRYKIAETHLLQEQYDLAYPQFLQAQGLVEQLYPSAYTEYLTALTRLKLAKTEVYRGNFAKAKKIYEEELIARVAERKTELAVELNTGLGSVHYELNKLSEAISYYKKAVEVIEEGRQELHVEQFRIGYFSKHIAPYQALTRCFLEQYEQAGNASDLDSLFHYMEMSRARSLQDLRFGELPKNLDQRKESPEYLAYLKAKKQLQAIQRDIRQAPSKYDALYPRYETARYQLIATRLRLLEPDEQNGQAPVALDSVLSQLRNVGTGLLFYHLSDHTSFALAANHQEVKVIRLQVNSDTLTSLVNTLLRPFYSLSETVLDSIAFHASVAHDLYNILIKPVEQQMRLEDRLIIIPDHALQRLPFELLLMNPPKKKAYFPADSTQYAQDFLLQRYTFLYSPTTRLTQISDRDDVGTKPKILVLANPATPSPKFTLNTQMAFRTNWRLAANLYYADSEGDSIKAIYPETKILKRNQATVPAFQSEAPQHDILHFATHAFVDTVFDAFSGLVLATGEDSTEDGLLMGYEITEQRFDCELVTLSACETGRGKLVQGEGVLGLPRQFIQAGARNVLMTLWQVSDQFTLSLMPKFYDAFLKNNVTRSVALRQAKLAMLGKSRADMLGKRLYYQHPFFWAPFALYGTPEEAAPDKTGGASLPLLILVGILLIAGPALFYYIRQKKA